MRTHRRLLTIATLLIMLATASVAAAGPASTPNGLSGFRALTGRSASAFTLPADVQSVWTTTHPRPGLTQTRYQQYVGAAQVLGGQLTILRKGSQQVAVIGSHYPGLVATSAVKLSPGAARAVAERDIGSDGRWITTLMIDPANRQHFYRVENQRFDTRWFFWIDAANGTTLKKYDGIETGSGTGVKGDQKTIGTTFNGSSYVMDSTGNRQATYDAGQVSRQAFLPGTLFTDADDVWDTPGRLSPGHPAAVDAHYYAAVTDNYYGTVFGRDSIDDNGMQIISSVHYKHNYNNAFWNGSQMTYGDGDGREFREFSGAQDVVAHELTHGVTDFTSGLIYENESGALNESFSDIIGNSVEFFANEATTSNCVRAAGQSTCADWLISEDISLVADAAPGFRNMSDPQEDNDPDHYSELINDRSDAGGVHSNSGISNHAYYLLVNGGKNAGCGPNLSGHSHTADCDVTVAGIGLAKAEQIFYAGFTSLPENATMANARYSTAAAAAGLYGVGSAEETATNAAWQAVGVASAPPPGPCMVTVTTLPFESAHPYAPDFTCTWVYTNPTANYRFHFDLLDLEEGFDYVDILDANGNVLESVTGTFRSGYNSAVIPTQVGKVRLRTDQLINKRGFRVDAILAP